MSVGQEGAPGQVYVVTGHRYYLIKKKQAPFSAIILWSNMIIFFSELNTFSVAAIDNRGVKLVIPAVPFSAQSCRTCILI
jgi:hypothetical protein